MSLLCDLGGWLRCGSTWSNEVPQTRYELVSLLFYSPRHLDSTKPWLSIPHPHHNSGPNFSSIVHPKNKGGVLLLVDGNFEILNEHKHPQERAYGDGNPGASWFARMCYGTLFPPSPLVVHARNWRFIWCIEAYNFMKLRGSNVDAGIMLERWMHETPGLEEVGGITHYIPIGPWDTCECSFVVPDSSPPLPPPAGKLITDHGKNGNFF